MINNGSISEQLKLQKQEFQLCERETRSSQDNNQRNWFSFNHENKEARNHAFNTDEHITSKQESNNSTNQSTNQSSNQENNRTVDLSISIVSLGMGIPESSVNSENQVLKLQKKKRKF